MRFDKSSNIRRIRYQEEFSTWNKLKMIESLSLEVLKCMVDTHFSGMGS